MYEVLTWKEEREKKIQDLLQANDENESTIT